MKHHSDVPTSYAFTWLAGIIVIVNGCSGGGGTISPPDPLDAAWETFEGGDHAAAYSSFLSAIGADPSSADARNGLGWTLAHLDSLDAALVRFNESIAIASTFPDPLAGRAVVAAEIPDHALAIGSAEAALAITPRFEFVHGTEVDWQDLRLIIAQSAFATLDYARCLAQVDSLGGVAPDPEAPDFADALLAELERLGSILSARPVVRRTVRRVLPAGRAA